MGSLIGMIMKHAVLNAVMKDVSIVGLMNSRHISEINTEMEDRIYTVPSLFKNQIIERNYHMKKVTYHLGGLFSVKKIDDSHLNARSYPYPLTSTIRGAIFASIIRLRGAEIAKELFNEVKNATIYIQFPKSYQVNQQKLRTTNNAFYSAKRGDVIDTIVGVREYIDMDKIVFYIDANIPELEVYLNNIEYIGKSTGLVSLEKVEDVEVMENVLISWNEERDGDQELYELVDWKNNTRFEDVYIYNGKGRSRSHFEKNYCMIKEKVSIQEGVALYG